MSRKPVALGNAEIVRQPDARPQQPLTRTTRAIGTAALVLMAANLSASVLGYVRSAVVGAVFGEHRVTDAFFAASLIPQMFYDLTIGAAISAALIPTFTEIYERHGREALRETAGKVMALAWVVLAAVTGILFLIARPLMLAILARSHQQISAAGIDDAVRIVHVILFSLFFLGTSAVFLSTLYSIRRFTVSAFAPGLYHAGIIVSAVLLTRPLGVLSLPVGAVAGAAAQAAIQVPSLLRRVGRLRIRLRITPEIRGILRLYAPIALGLVVSLVGQAIDAGFKWQLHSGGFTAMQLGTTLTQFPIGIAVAGLSFAILPSISADASFGRMREFKETLASGMRLVLFLTVPAAVGFLVLSTPIAAVLFQHGKIDAAGTARISTALTGYAIQIPFVGIDQLLIFAFYARKNTVTPMLIGVVGVGIYVFSAVLLMPRFQILGLALANTLQNSIHGLILLGLLLAAIGTLRGTGLVGGVVRIACAAAVMAAGAGAAWLALHAAVPLDRFSGRLADAGLPVLLGLALYVGTSWLLKSEELRFLLQILSRRSAVSDS